MQKWEYHLVSSNSFTYDRVRILTDVGREGWELVQILWRPRSEKITLFVFKRPISDV